MRAQMPERIAPAPASRSPQPRHKVRTSKVEVVTLAGQLLVKRLYSAVAYHANGEIYVARTINGAGGVGHQVNFLLTVAPRVEAVL